jgi:hypothetical protein
MAASSSLIYLLVLLAVPGVMASFGQLVSYAQLRRLPFAAMDRTLLQREAFHIDFVMGIAGLITMTVWSSLTPALVAHRARQKDSPLHVRRTGRCARDHDGHFRDDEADLSHGCFSATAGARIAVNRPSVTIPVIERYVRLESNHMQLLHALVPGSIPLLSLFIALLPLLGGTAYVLEPTNQRLALMRPLSLAAIFSGLRGATLGLILVLRALDSEHSPELQAMATGVAESLITLFLAFASLTLAWLCVAAVPRNAL